MLDKIRPSKYLYISFIITIKKLYSNKLYLYYNDVGGAASQRDFLFFDSF